LYINVIDFYARVALKGCQN